MLLFIFKGNGMKMSTIVKCFCVALFATFCFETAFAQSPDKQMGVGVTAGTAASAAHMCYAISPAFHLGAQFGIDLASSGGTSSNSVYFAPYGKFILAGTKDFKPYFFGAFTVQSNNGTTTSLSLGGGGEYFATKNVGVFGHVSIINIGFSPSYSHIGIVFPQVGVEWFFN